MNEIRYTYNQAAMLKQALTVELVRQQSNLKYFKEAEISCNKNNNKEDHSCRQCALTVEKYERNVRDIEILLSEI